MMLTDYIAELKEKGYEVNMRYDHVANYLDIRVMKNRVIIKSRLDRDIFLSDEVEDIVQKEIYKLVEELG